MNEIPAVIGVPTESVRHLLQVVEHLATFMDSDQGIHMRDHLLEVVRSIAKLNEINEEDLLDKLLYK